MSGIATAGYRAGRAAAAALRISATPSLAGEPGFSLT
jgi:hypothetical protein